MSSEVNDESSEEEEFDDDEIYDDIIHSMEVAPNGEQGINKLDRIFDQEFHPEYLDICWEFADSEEFLVDGLVLLNSILSQNRKIFEEFGITSLTVIYLAEKFLHSFKDRGGMFSLVFFSNSPPSQIKDIFIAHFKENTSVKVWTEFIDPFDVNFVKFVTEFRPSFILTSFEQHLNFLQYSYIGLNMAAIDNMSRTIVERKAWYHHSFPLPTTLMEKVSELNASQPKYTEPYEFAKPSRPHSANVDQHVFHKRVLQCIRDECGCPECVASFYIQFVADILNMRLTLYTRRKIFPKFFQRLDNLWKCSKQGRNASVWTKSLFDCPVLLIPLLLDPQIQYNLLNIMQTTGRLDILHLIPEETVRQEVSMDLGKFDHLKQSTEEFFSHADLRLNEVTLERSTDNQQIFFITSHPLHTMYPKDVLSKICGDLVQPAVKNGSSRYLQFVEEYHWHSLKKISSEYERIPSNDYGGKQEQNYASFVQRYGTSLEGRNVTNSPIVVKDSDTTGKKQKKKAKEDKTSGAAVKIQLDKFSKDFNLKSASILEKVEQTKRSGLPENESLHAECLSLKAETDKSLVSLAAKIPAKSKLKQDFTKIESGLKSFFAAELPRVTSRLLKLKFSKWKESKTKENKIEVLMFIKKNEEVVKALGGDKKDKVIEYLDRLGFEDLAASLFGELSLDSKLESSKFIRFQLEEMGRWIVKTPPHNPDPRIPNFNPDQWQRDMFDAIDARESALIIAPTSSGKTYAAYYAMESVLKESDDGVVVYIAPTKALVNQVAATVSARYGHRKKMPPGKSVYGTFTREYRYKTMHCQVLVTVPECLEILMLSPRNFWWVKRLRYIIFDEIHNIGGESRGECWEHLLTLIRCPMIALSATVQNPGDLLNWLQTLENYKKKMDDQDSVAVHSRSYTVRMIPREGKVERHSDLTKFIVRREDGRAGLDNIHPVSYLNVGDLLRKKEFPECMTMSPAECIRLFDELKHEFDTEALNHADPAQMFECRFLDRDDIQTLNTAIKTFLLSLEDSPENNRHLSNAIGKLPPGCNQKPKIQEDTRPQLHKNFPALVDKLRQDSMLPALVFVFDRSLCSGLAATMTRTFKKRIEEVKNSDEYLAKKRKEEKTHKAVIKLVKKAKNKAEDKEKDKDGKEKDTKPSTCVEEIFQLNEYSKEFPEHSLISKHTLGPEDARYILGRLQEAPDMFVRMLQFGISYHHAGNNAKLKSSTEMMFREKFLNLVVSTTTLAQGIHMPCQTVVFAGDSIFLNSLNYHQCSGRAGRRGFDTQGNVIFYGIKESKVARLMNSNLPLIFGNSPSSISLVLRLFCYTSNEMSSSDREDAVQRAYGCLKNPLLTERIPELDTQLQTFFLYAVNFLQNQEYVDEDGQPIGFAGLASHLTHHEPFNFAFCHLLQEGVLHRLVRKTPKGEISFDSLVDLLTVVCFLFGRIKVYEMPLKISDNDYEPKFAALPPVAPFVLETLQGFNTMLTSTYKSYIDSIAAISSSEDLPVTLPISGISFSCLNTREVEPLSELAGVGRVDEGESARLASNLRADLMTDTMPGIDIEESISGYARAFFKSGDLRSMTTDYGMRPGECFPNLMEILMTLKSINTSLAEMKGATEGGEEDLLVEAFNQLTTEFNRKFNKAFDINKGQRLAWGNYQLHPSNCRACSIITVSDTIENRGRKWKVRGSLDCSSAGCIILLKCISCRKGFITTCKQSVAHKVDSLAATWTHFVNAHQVELMVVEKVKKLSDKALEDARLQWQSKLMADQL